MTNRVKRLAKKGRSDPTRPREKGRKSARSQREPKREFDEELMLKVLARPNQIARDVRADYVAASEPTLSDFSMFQIPLDRHCPLAVIERFQAHDVMMPWFWKRDEAGKLTPCGFTDSKWDECSITTLRKLETRAYSFHKPVVRVHGASGGVARQWLHLSDECEHALQCVTNPPLFAQTDQRCYQGDNDFWQPDSEEIPKLATNISLGTVMRSPARSVNGFYLPLPYEHEGKWVENYFTIGLSAAGHAVLFWATMHIRLALMLKKLKDHRDRASMKDSFRFIVEAKPVLEWEKGDIDTLNAVRGEVLAFDEYWDDMFNTASKVETSAALEAGEPSAEIAGRLSTNLAERSAAMREPEVATVSAMKKAANEVLNSKSDWSNSWLRVCKEANVIVPRGKRNHVLTREEAFLCANAAGKVIAFGGKQIEEAWKKRFVWGRPLGIARVEVVKKALSVQREDRDQIEMIEIDGDSERHR
jgi:hypothetical protein